MPASETAKLLASLGLVDNLTPSIKKMSGSLDKFDARLGKSSSRSFKAGQQIGTGIKTGLAIAIGAIGAVGGLLLASAKEGQDAQKVQLKYAQAIKNSGKVSDQYVTALNAQQDALLQLSGADDEAIKSLQTRLITMGLTGQQVLTLVPLIQDAATSTGRDIDTIATAVGKAALGSTAGLGKLGIIIPKTAKATKSAASAALELQKNQLAVAIAHERTITATTKAEKKAKDHRVAILAQQKALLDERIAQQKVTDSTTKGTKAVSAYDQTVAALSGRFKGTTAALSGGLDVKLKVFNERLANIREEAGIKLLPALTRIVDVVGTKLVPAFGKFIDAVLPIAISGLEKLAGFLEGGGAQTAFTKFFDAAKTAAPVIQKAAEATLAAIKAAVDLFSSLPPELQALAVTGFIINKGTGGLLTNVAGGVAGAVAGVGVRAALGGGGAAAAGAAGSAGLLATMVSFIPPIAVAVGAYLLATNVLGPQSDRNRGQEAALKTQTDAFTGGASLADINKATAGVDGQIARLRSELSLEGAAFQFNIDGVKDSVLGVSAELHRQQDYLSRASAEGWGVQRVTTSDLGGAGPTADIIAGQDAAERAQQGRNAARSNPTRAMLRAQIAAIKDKTPTRETKKAIANLQHQLDERIRRGNVIEAAANIIAVANRLAIVSAIRENRPAINVSVPVYATTTIDGRTFTANLSRYQSFTSGIDLSRGVLP